MKNLKQMQRKRSSWLAGIVICLVVGRAGPAASQVLEEWNPGVEFNFSTPGARSLALGGAFIGLADDATAAYVNPAGLTTLQASELGLEVRSFEYTVTYPDAGHLGQETGMGVDTVSGVVFADTTGSTTNLSFLSYTFAGEGWSLAVYRHQLADFSSEFKTQGPFFGDGTPTSPLGRAFPAWAETDLDVVNYGGSAAVNFGAGVSAGLGISYYEVAFDSVLRSFDVVDDPFAPANYDPSNLYSQRVATGDGGDWGLNVGLLWRATNAVWLGAVFRQGPSFDLTYAGTCGPSDPDYCTASGNEFEVAGSFNVPDVYGLGIALKPSDSFTVTMDYAHVTYGDLAEDVVGVPYLLAMSDEFGIDDGDEYHVGLEYGFTSLASPLFLRLGGWLDPVHKYTYHGSDELLSLLWAANNSADDQWHYTGGVGVAFASGRFQVDLAADVSDRVDTFSLSGVYRF
jgi:hypothetical protein